MQFGHEQLDVYCLEACKVLTAVEIVGKSFIC